MRYLIRFSPVLLFVLYIAYYYFAHQETVPITGRKQLVDMSPQQEASLGLQSYQKILQKSEVLREGDIVDSVRKIGQKLAAVSGAQGFKWEFNVIQSNQINAFCLPGGKVAVYTGIVPVAKNVSGMAVVMGHEIAHAIARHGAERIAHQKLMRLGMMAVSMSIGDMDVDTQRMVIGAFGLGSQYGVLLPFSRQHESEADYMGLVFVARACFDPREAPLLWQRMGEASGGKASPEFTSTHPSHATRIQQFQQWMPEALKIRAQYCKSE